MCLITRFPKIITKKDLVVYKLLRDDLTSPWLNYRYALNSLVIFDFKTNRILNYTTEFHAKNILPNEIIKQIQINDSFIICIRDTKLHLQSIDNGLHSFRTLADAVEYKNSLFFGPSTQIYKAVIPAGSALYINYKQIVSNQLIIKNIAEL